YQLPTLTIPSKNHLCPRTFLQRCSHKPGHLLRPAVVATIQEALDAGWVVDALNCYIASSNPGCDIGKHRRAYYHAYIARLDSPTRKNESQWSASTALAQPVLSDL